VTEPTAQQDETPQPPPEKREDGTEGEKSLPEHEQLKAETFFVTFFEPHFGQQLPFSEPTLCKREKVSLHLSQTYS
jgi:hypothetical protein